MSELFLIADVDSGPIARSDATVSAAIDFNALVWHASGRDGFGPWSLSVGEIDSDGRPLGTVAHQWESGRLYWKMPGKTPPNTGRKFRIGFAADPGPRPPKNDFKGRVVLTDLGNEVQFSHDTRELCRYRYRSVYKPFFCPVNGPHGNVVRDIVHDNEGHYFHHGVWIGYGSMDHNSANLWCESDKLEPRRGPTGRMVHESFEQFTFGWMHGVFKERLAYQKPDGHVFAREWRTVRVSRPSAETLAMDFEITLQEPDDSGPRNTMFCARVAPSMRLVDAANGNKPLEKPGQIECGEGWADFSGPVGTGWNGIAIFSHPSNPGGPATPGASGYGIISTGHVYPTADEYRGATATYRYRAWVHDGGAQKADVQAAYGDYIHPCLVTTGGIVCATNKRRAVMSRLKYALIGCGRRGQAHIQAVAALKDLYEVVAVCDAHAGSAQQAAGKLGVTAYTDIRKLADSQKIDVCDVVVPGDLHHAVSCYLSTRGIHHNVETPLAPTLGLMDLMIEAAKKHNVKLQTSENFPFTAVEQFACKAIQAGAIGKVHRTYRLFSTTGYHGLASICLRMGARPLSVSSIGHSMPVAPYVDYMKRDFSSDVLEFYAIGFEGGGLAIAMVGNKNGCLGRNKLAGFESCGERGTIITNGNQGATGGETINTCTDEELARRAGEAVSYPFEREFTASKTLKRIWADLPKALGGCIEWTNPFCNTALPEGSISLATMLSGLARAVHENGPPLWPGENGRSDQEMMIAGQRSICADRKPISLPLKPDPKEEEAFDREFEQRFGACPREDAERVLQISFNAR